jgi:photosystem II stability/assembly factor-like uncharacterized protein
LPFSVVLLAVVLSLHWQAERSDTLASLRGIHSLSESAAWASGTRGTVLLRDGGPWKACVSPADSRELDFRGVWGWDSLHAIVMSSGPGTASRLYRTEDGCRSWNVVARNQDEDGFWDAFVFADANDGFLLGDPVMGRFVVMDTHDGGMTWSRDESAALRSDHSGEGAFAASNSSLAVTPDGQDIFFGTGGRAGARIFHRRQGVWTWSRVRLGAKVESAGVFSIALRDSVHGVAVGGDFKTPGSGSATAVWTADAGASWHPARTEPGGYRSSVSWDAELRAWVTVGPNGTDISRDDGSTWQSVDKGNWNASSLPWVCGPNGRLAKLTGAP